MYDIAVGSEKPNVLIRIKVLMNLITMNEID